MVKNKKGSFKEVLAEIESPKYHGQGSWALPRNATAAEKTKYEICEKVLGYQEDSNLSYEVMARQLHLTIAETEDILFCRVSLMNIAEIKVTVEPQKDTADHLWVQNCYPNS